MSWKSRFSTCARRSKTARFGFALACFLAASVAWQLMVVPLADTTPYQVLLPFVALAAWFGGLGPGLLTTVLCAVWAISHSNAALSSMSQQLELGLFLPIGAFIAALSGSLGAARGQAEDVASQLATSQQRYQSIVETASEGIWLTDAAMKTTFVNARMAQHLGVAPEAMLGRDVTDFLFEEDREIPVQNIAAHRDVGHFETEGRYRHPNGAEIWFLINISLLRDERGELTGILALHTDITERRQQNEALRRSYERFELATRAVEGYIYECDPKDDSVFRSSGFRDVTGYDPAQIPQNAEWWREQIHPDDVEEFDLLIAHALSGADQFSVECRARHADGSYRWLWDQGIVVRDENGEVSCIVGSVSDISGRKAMETALRDSAESFRQLADSMPQIVWSSDARGAPDYFNRRWYDYCGQNSSTTGRWSLEEFIHPDDVALARTEWAAAHEQCAPYRIEARLRDKNGGYRWFLCRAIPIFDSQSSQIVRWFGTATDIDEAKRAADTQKFLADVGVLLGGSLDPAITLEQVTRLAVPHLGDWCFVALKNAQGVPEMVAAAHRDPEKIAAFWKRHLKYGFDPDAAKGFPYVIRTGNPEVIAEVDAEMWREALPGQVEYQKEVGNGGHHSTLVVPLEVRGQILGGIGFSYSESERHFSDADLPLAQEIARRAAIAIENARLYRQLQDADRRKDEFLAMLAHELRNPLAAISGARNLIDELLEGDSLALTALPRAILERQTSHLARLVDDLLDVSRITRGKIELRRQNVNWVEIVKNALDGVRSLIESRRHDLKIDFSNEVITVDADPARLGQIVSNLLTNAAKYTDAGGKITVSLRREGSEAILRVNDNGTGLSSEMLHLIWGLFVQSDRTLDRSQGGLGIGLTLVKSLAEMHGGRVGAFSAGIGKGSEFIVALPCLDANQSEASKEVSKPEIEVLNPEKQGLAISKRVLVVDDNEDAALMLSAWLQNQGYEVKTAHDGAQGLAVARGWNPEIALLDIGMPEMDGYALARELRALPQGNSMRLVAVTGYGQPADREAATQAGFDFHLTKPVEMEALRAMMQSEK